MSNTEVGTAMTPIVAAKRDHDDMQGTQTGYDTPGAKKHSVMKENSAPYSASRTPLGVRDMYM